MSAAKKGRPPSDNIPPKLHKLMQDAGIRTITELATKTGVQQSVLSRNLSGELKVSLKTALAITKAFGLSDKDNEGFALLSELENLNK